MVEPLTTGRGVFATVGATVSHGIAVVSAGVRWLPLLTAAASALRSSAMAARDDRESKARRRVARTLVATYHEAELAGLVERSRRDRALPSG
jgi:hypothetical protein